MLHITKRKNFFSRIFSSWTDEYPTVVCVYSSSKFIACLFLSLVIFEIAVTMLFFSSFNFFAGESNVAAVLTWGHDF